MTAAQLANDEEIQRLAKRLAEAEREGDVTLVSLRKRHAEELATLERASEETLGALRYVFTR